MNELNDLGWDHLTEQQQKEVTEAFITMFSGADEDKKKKRSFFARVFGGGK